MDIQKNQAGDLTNSKHVFLQDENADRQNHAEDLANTKLHRRTFKNELCIIVLQFS